MSGLLDRMVQRARGALPAVEPLVAPQWTALAAQQAPAEETHDSHAPMRQPKRRFVESREDAPLPAANGGGAEESAQNAAPVQGASRSGEMMRVRSDRHADGDSATDASGVAAAAQPVLAELEPHALEVRTVSVAKAELHARAPELPVPPESGDAKPPRREPASAAKPVPRSPSQGMVHGAQSASSASSPLMEAAGDHTEIHITIGSIELRAPRTEAKAPAFRPRVTLDEFLNRRPGAAS
ncbi:MAG: hypothetical protein WBM14_14630 [Terracidiphilus sp.]